MSVSSLRGLSLVVALVAVWPAPRQASACAPAPMPGQRVAIAGEDALIVWDEARHTQHFIRRATFATSATDFGFLVPTPTQPVLAEVPDSVFGTLHAATQPEVRREYTRGLQPTLSCVALMLSSRGGAEMQAASAPVRVLDSRRVAGYDAVVLEADSPTALAEWLRVHGYESRPTLTDWLAPYVAARWKVTAFRIAPREPGGENGGISTSAVRMTFTTERPFYPYREPSDQRTEVSGPRMLRVFFVSHARVAGTLGEQGRWPGLVTYSRPLPDLASRLGLATLSPWPATTWLTAFEDRSSPRPGTDEVYFRPSSDRAEVIPPPLVFRTESSIPIPLDLVALPCVVAWWIWRRRRKRREAKG